MTAAVVVALALATTAASAATAAPARRLVLDGLPVYVQDTGGERVQLRAYVRVGDRPDDAAAAALAAAWMSLGGTRSLPGREFEAAVAELDFEVRAYVVPDLLVVEAHTTPERFRPSCRLFADLLMYPAFGPKQLRPARAAAIAPAAPDDALELVDANLALDGATPGRVHERLSAAATADAVPPPTREQVVELHRRRVGIDTTVAVVTGPLAAIDVKRELGAAFLGFQRAADPVAVRTSEEESDVGRGSTTAWREHSGGRTRLLVARRGLPRGHPDWLVLELGIVAAFLTPELDRKAALAARLRIEQPLGEPDLLLLDASVPTNAVAAWQGSYQTAFAELANRNVSAPALERARAWLSRALVPPATAADAAIAHALLEALGADGAQPEARHQALMEIERQQVLRAAARHLRY